MPITLGEKQFLNNERFGDDAILVWVDPTKEMHVVAGTVKVDQADGNPNIGYINHTTTWTVMSFSPLTCSTKTIQSEPTGHGPTATGDITPPYLS